MINSWRAHAVWHLVGKYCPQLHFQYHPTSDGGKARQNRWSRSLLSVVTLSKLLQRIVQTAASTAHTGLGEWKGAPSALACFFLFHASRHLFEAGSTEGEYSSSTTVGTRLNSTMKRWKFLFSRTFPFINFFHLHVVCLLRPPLGRENKEAPEHPPLSKKWRCSSSVANFQPNS